MTDELELPKPRHRLTININTNDMNDLREHLQHLLDTCLLFNDDKWLDRDELLVTGGGYTITNRFNPDMTKEQYREALIAWNVQRRNS